MRSKLIISLAAAALAGWPAAGHAGLKCAPGASVGIVEFFFDGSWSSFDQASIGFDCSSERFARHEFGLYVAPKFGGTAGPAVGSKKTRISLMAQYKFDETLALSFGQVFWDSAAGLKWDTAREKRYFGLSIDPEGLQKESPGTPSTDNGNTDVQTETPPTSGSGSE